MTWEFEHSIVTNARKEIIWALYSRVESWPLWDHGIEDISLDGALREGTKGKIKPEGQGLLSYRITLADPEKGFSEETVIDVLGTPEDIPSPISFSAPSLSGQRTVI